MISNLRAIKQPEELRLINNCIEIAEISMRNLIQHGASKFLGRSERDIAVELERIMVTHGADRQGFPGSGIIVASGPNSASAHHRPGPRIVQSGDPVLIDWGAEYEGYRSDMTRTFFVRSLPDYAITGYPVVELALRKAAALLRAGQTLGSVDRTARETITSAGYEEFHYGVGHGVGLEIHEEPWIRSHSIETFCAGMVTTIEPGIYLNGIGGIRVENMFHIIEDRAENLPPFPTSIDNMILR